MQKRSWTLAVLALAAASAVTPALSQGLVIGRDGVTIVDPRARGYDDDGPRRGDSRRDRDREDRHREITEREAIRIARSQGLRELDDVDRTRSTFRVVGEDRRGRDIRVTIDRRSGEVLSVR